MDASGVGLDGEADPVVHRRGQRLRTAHPTQPAGEHDAAAQRVLKVPCRDRSERFIGALENPLGADVDPRPGRHLAVHDQPTPFQIAEHVPGREPADQVGVGNEHARRVGMRRENRDRFA